MVLKDHIFNSFYFGLVWWSSKNSYLTLSNLGGYGGLERSHCQYILLWECVVVLKELILTLSTLAGCGGLEGTSI